jgi:hypothetical protein
MSKDEPKKKNEEKPKSGETHEPIGGSHVPGQQPGQQSDPPPWSEEKLPAGAGWGGGQKQDSGQQQVMTMLAEMMKLLWSIKSEVVKGQQIAGEHFSGAGGYQNQPQAGSFGPQTQTGGGKSY